MKLDISPVLSGETREVPFAFTMDATGGTAGEYLSGLEMKPSGVIKVTGKVYSMTAYMTLDLSAEMPFVTGCARCNKPTESVCRFEMHRIVSATADNVDGGDGDDVLVYENRELELNTPVLEELLLSFPSKTLCKPDCLGLCPVCGHDLNEGDCGCTSEKQ